MTTTPSTLRPRARHRVTGAGSRARRLHRQRIQDPRPALRLGWLLAPTGLRDDLVEAKRWTDLASPALSQLVLAQLITSGALDRHLRLTRVRYRHHRNAVLEALAEHLPTARVHGVAAGLHLLVSLPELDDDVALAARALTHGVAVHALSWHRQQRGPAGLVIGYAACSPDRLREAVW